MRRYKRKRKEILENHIPGLAPGNFLFKFPVWK
jgi:hypothetical protein